MLNTQAVCHRQLRSTTLLQRHAQPLHQLKKHMTSNLKSEISSQSKKKHSFHKPKHHKKNLSSFLFSSVIYLTCFHVVPFFLFFHLFYFCLVPTLGNASLANFHYLREILVPYDQFPTYFPNKCGLQERGPCFPTRRSLYLHLSSRQIRK